MATKKKTTLPKATSVEPTVVETEETVVESVQETSTPAPQPTPTGQSKKIGASLF